MSTVSVLNTDSALSGKTLALIGSANSGNLLFTDATYDIGQSGATRPRDLFLSRNAVIGGTLAVTGAGTFASTLDATGNFNVNTNKFSVVAASGNTTVAGTLAVTGTSAFTGAVAFSGIQTAAAQLRAGVHHNTTQSLTNNTETAVVFNTEDYDVGAMHDTGSNTSRFTVPTGGDGLYLLTAAIHFSANATGRRYARWQKNGSNAIGTWSLISANSVGGGTTCVLALIWPLVATEYVEVMAYQDSGGALNIGDAGTSYLMNHAQVAKLW